MSYSTGMLRELIHVMVRGEDATGKFGRNSAGREYKYAATLHAGFEFNRGTKSLREGAVSAYDTVMFRMRWNNIIDRQSMIVYNGTTYQIKSFNGNRYIDQIQITAVEAAGMDLSGLVPVASGSDLGDDFVSESDI